MTFQVGSLVRARGREWVVLPDSAEDFLMLRPLGGSDIEITGIAISRAPIIAASNGLWPSSIWRWIFSTTTIASSTTRPMHSTSASNVSRLTE